MIGDLCQSLFLAEFSHLCICPIFKITIQISYYRKMIRLSAIILCIGWKGQKVWQNRQGKGRVALCCIPLLTCLPIWDRLSFAKPHNTRVARICSIPGRKTLPPQPPKTALPLSMGWGAISCLRFLLGPEREFLESLLSVRGEATELGEEKKREFRPTTNFYSKSFHLGNSKHFKNFN